MLTSLTPSYSFLLKLAEIIKTGESLYMIYGTREDFIKARVQYIRDHEKARTFLRSTQSFEDHQILNTLDVYTGFQNLCSYFEKHEVVKRAALRTKLGALKFVNLKQYIDDFKRMLCQYQLVGRHRDSEEMIHTFLSTLPCDRYLHYKTQFQPTSMDEEFTYFKKIANAEAHYRSTESISTSFKKQSTVKLRNIKGRKLRARYSKPASARNVADLGTLQTTFKTSVN